jgi:hypothetical protein
MANLNLIKGLKYAKTRIEFNTTYTKKPQLKRINFSWGFGLKLL